MFRRDTSGPMDIDSMDPMARLAEFAEPPRKRPHADLSAPQASGSSSFRFGPNTPFLFHASAPPPPAPEKKWEPYDPQRWAGTDFGMGSATSGVADVDMDDGPEAHAAPGGSAGSAAGSGGSGTEPGAEEQAAAPASPSSPSSPAPKPRGARGKNRRKQATVEDEPEDDDGEERHIATGAITRVRRRRKEWARRGHAGEDLAPTYNLHLGPNGTQHRDIPGILLGYVQFVFNLSLVLFFLYLGVQFIVAIRRDVSERIDEYSVEILQEIAQCTQAYVTNRCEPGQRVPAMEAACGAWETCMNRDPKVVGRARVGAETFAEIINGFVDGISLKTMLFSTIVLALLVVLANSALFNLRAKQEIAHQRDLHQHKLAAMPQYNPYYLGAPGMPPQGPGMHGIQAPHAAPAQQQHALGLTAPPQPDEPKKSKWLKW